MWRLSEHRLNIIRTFMPCSQYQKGMAEVQISDLSTKILALVHIFPIYYFFRREKVNWKRILEFYDHAFELFRPVEKIFTNLHESFYQQVDNDVVVNCFLATQSIFKTMKTDEKIVIARHLSIVVEMTRKSFHYTLHEEEGKHIDINQTSYQHLIQSAGNSKGICNLHICRQCQLIFW